MCGRVVGMARLEFREPGRQGPQERTKMIRLEILPIKIKGNFSRPELIECIDHAATVLLPADSMARGEKSEARHGVLPMRSFRSGNRKRVWSRYRSDYRR